MINIYGTETKKMLNILILEILRKYSDEDHHLTQQEIIKLLRSEFGVEKVDRRTVRENVQSLVNMGYGIENEEKGGYYMYEREFEDAELRLLIDSVLFSKSIPDGTAKRLIEKISSLGSNFFQPKVSHVKPTPTINRTDNKAVLINVHFINEAIDAKKKIRFRYNKYGTDFKMHDQGKDYIMNPYQMVASNGQYYLLGNVDMFDDVAYYRIDKMSKVEILEEKVKPKSEVIGIEEHMDLPKHMAEHIYMFCGESVRAEIRTKTWMMDTLVDWFGKDFKILECKEDELMISVKCNKNALFYWALQYGTVVEVLSPKDLRDELAKETASLADKYKEKK